MEKATVAKSDVANRRTKLRLWIDTHFDGSQSRFIADCAEHGHEINQGELSGLLKTKSFGEKKARSLEAIARMPSKHLDTPPNTSVLPPGTVEITHIAREPRDDRWPFKKLKPWQWKLLTTEQKTHVENAALLMIEARAGPEKHSGLAYSHAATKPA